MAAIFKGAFTPGWIEDVVPKWWLDVCEHSSRTLMWNKTVESNRTLVPLFCSENSVNPEPGTNSLDRCLLVRGANVSRANMDKIWTFLHCCLSATLLPFYLFSHNFVSFRCSCVWCPISSKMCAPDQMVTAGRARLTFSDSFCCRCRCCCPDGPTMQSLNSSDLRAVGKTLWGCVFWLVLQ